MSENKQAEIAPLTLFQKFLLTAIIFASFIAHFSGITYPDRPVFDEAHFATYIASFASNNPVYDIHPPLGKAAPTGIFQFFEKRTFEDAEFVIISTSEIDGRSAVDAYVKPGVEYGEFPYIPARAWFAFFGALIPLMAFEAFRRITKSNEGALLASFFLAFDNAVLVFTKLILLDSMYIFFGLAALVLFFDKHPRYVFGGMLWGLALSVKLTAILFLGPMIVQTLFEIKKIGTRFDPKKLGILIVVGVVTLGILHIGINAMFFNPHSRLNTYVTLLPNVPETKIVQRAVENNLSSIETFMMSTIYDTTLILAGYTEQFGGSHPLQSAWYKWPIMRGQILLFHEGDREIALVGNPVVWFLSALAIVFGVLSIVKFRKKEELRNTLLVLLGGYLIALLPYMTFVNRTTFLWHYFPAFIFSVGAAGYLLSKFIETLKQPTRKYLYSAVVIATIAGFAYYAPLTYGF